ncbi:phosphatase PAP2 family protein [Intrasporangium sp.]|uniref:phosphatase PAP2 family protein n=1 Tax=Intrasporangium sp. TaxID=1925024 RepID=UPI002939851F|nr:phosphatase PAP2 family protein [Intrasporangium sp.]MDV3223230.1 phosphatase PAP2 family protein [Intrasporangium sp.]
MLPRPRGREPEQIGSRDLTSWPSHVGRWLVQAAVELGRRAPWVGRLYGWSSANLAFVAFAVIALGLAVSLTRAAAEVYEAVTDRDGIAAVDEPVLDLAVDLRTPELNEAVTWFTDVGGPVGMPVLAVLVVGGLALHWRTWRPVVLAVVAASGSLLMTVATKGLADRARPPLELAVPPFESSPSFPSGHTLNATVVAAVVVYLVLLRSTAAWQRVLAVLTGSVFVLAMGLSRVFLGHHWLTDVIAGWALGLAWALAVVTAHRLVLTLRADPGKSSPTEAGPAPAEGRAGAD